MNTSQKSLLAVSVLALGWALEPSKIERAAQATDPLPSLHQALAPLELSDAQRERIEALERSEEAWIAKLEKAQRTAEAALREAEVRQPFDPTHVGILVRRKAEIAAFLRGTESRLVAAILTLLEPAQRNAFSQLRSGSAPGEDVPSRGAANPAEASGFSL